MPKRKKKKKYDIEELEDIELDESDFPLHEEYVKERPVKK